MNWGKELSDEAAAWALIGGKPEEVPGISKVRAMSLLEFLKLIKTADFAFREEAPGRNARCTILKEWITVLQAAKLDGKIHSIERLFKDSAQVDC